MTLIIPFIGLLIALHLRSYRTYCGPRARRWFRVLTWISAVYAVGFAIGMMIAIHAHRRSAA